jgi:dTDP-4-dehydrorhamnose 3,5-epimerase
MMEDIKKYAIKFHEDDRAQRLQDVFKMGMPDEQINISYINSTEHCVGWHYHTKQTEYWFVVKGALKVGLAKSDTPAGNDKTSDGAESQVEFEYLSDKNQQVLEIPSNIYHGYKALIPGTILMYYITEKYDKVSMYDDKRVPIGYFGEDWDTLSK